MTEEAQRPSKKPRVENSTVSPNNMDRNDSQQTHKNQGNRVNWRPNHPRGHNKRPPSRPQQSSGDAPTSRDDGFQRRNNAPRTFSQTSVITAGDKGIFVTCDKGREKKSLIELGDLVEDYLETASLYHPDSKSETKTTEEKTQATIPKPTHDISSDEEDLDIESAINSELSTLSNAPSQTSKPIAVKPFQLITLDVPCVSFLRFHPLHPSYHFINPTILIHSLCAAAMKTGRIRSRNIRRLSPVFNLQKCLSNGLERCADSVLPLHFSIPSSDTNLSSNSNNQSQSESEKIKGYTFSIRPTTRNNTSVSRDDVIKYVADRVSDLGQGTHKVDLKHYQKGILVETYRGWIGMAVVDNEIVKSDGGDGEGFVYGYEELKRFNLAEIYTEGMRRKEEEGE